MRQAVTDALHLGVNVGLIGALEKELVAAAMEYVSFAKLGNEHFANLADRIITGSVPELVVQRLEIVGVGETLDGQQFASIERVNVCGLVANASDGAPADLRRFAVQFEQVLILLLLLRIQSPRAAVLLVLQELRCVVAAE